MNILITIPPHHHVTGDNRCICLVFVVTVWLGITVYLCLYWCIVGYLSFKRLIKVLIFITNFGIPNPVFCFALCGPEHLNRWFAVCIFIYFSHFGINVFHRHPILHKNTVLTHRLIITLLCFDVVFLFWYWFCYVRLDKLFEKIIEIVSANLF